MNMILLTGLSVGLALSIMNANNFYANSVTTTSINQATHQIQSVAVPVANANQYMNGSNHNGNGLSDNHISDAYHWMEDHRPNK